MDVCTHDVTDREVAAIADGLCPLCLHGMTMRQSLAIEKLRAALTEARDVLEILDMPNGTENGLACFRGGKPIGKIIDAALAE
jgi:hypothetical protein